MQGNYTVLDEQKYLERGAIFKGRKPAKLSTYKVFYPKTKALQNSVKKENQNINMELKNSQPVKEPVKTTETTNIQTPIQPTMPVNNTETSNNISNTFSEEKLNELESKLNVNFYSSINSKNIKLTTYRRLKVAVLVVNSLKKVRNYTTRIMDLLEKVEEPKKEQFDFSQLPNISSMQETEVKSDIPTPKNEEVNTQKVNSNEVLLDKFFKEGRTNTSDNVSESVDDSYINQINSLTKEKENTEDSLATQKEILANLRKRIEQNKVLCEAKKQELMEENMALTQELNDVLAEINQLSDIANQQEAFLGISNDLDDSYSR